MRVAFVTLAILLLFGSPARPAKKDWTIAFVGPLSGPLQERTEAYLEGVRNSAAAWSGSSALEERALNVLVIDDADDPKRYKKVASAIGKAKPLLIVGVPSGRGLESLTQLAR